MMGSLFEAVDEVNIERVRLLLSKGADVNTVTDGGVTPLMIGCERGDRDLVDLLLRSGASTKPVTQTSQSSCLHFAAKVGAAHVIRRLLQDDQSLLEGVTRNGDTALMLACLSTSGTGEGVARVGAGAGKDKGNEAVAVSAILEFLPCEDILSHLGLCNRHGHTALHAAAYARAPGAVRILLGATVGGSTTAAIDRTGCTPLQVAITLAKAENEAKARIETGGRYASGGNSESESQPAGECVRLLQERWKELESEAIEQERQLLSEWNLPEKKASDADPSADARGGSRKVRGGRRKSKAKKRKGGMSPPCTGEDESKSSMLPLGKSKATTPEQREISPPPAPMLELGSPRGEEDGDSDSVVTKINVEGGREDGEVSFLNSNISISVPDDLSLATPALEKSCGYEGGLGIVQEEVEGKGEGRFQLEGKSKVGSESEGQWSVAMRAAGKKKTKSTREALKASKIENIVQGVSGNLGECLGPEIGSLKATSISAPAVSEPVVQVNSAIEESTVGEAFEASSTWRGCCHINKTRPGDSITHKISPPELPINIMCAETTGQSDIFNTNRGGANDAGLTVDMCPGPGVLEEASSIEPVVEKTVPAALPLPTLSGTEPHAQGTPTTLRDVESLQAALEVLSQQAAAVALKIEHLVWPPEMLQRLSMGQLDTLKATLLDQAVRVDEAKLEQAREQERSKSEENNILKQELMTAAANIGRA